MWLPVQYFEIYPGPEPPLRMLLRLLLEKAVEIVAEVVLKYAFLLIDWLGGPWGV